MHPGQDADGCRFDELALTDGVADPVTSGDWPPTPGNGPFEVDGGHDPFGDVGVPALLGEGDGAL